LDTRGLDRFLIAVVLSKYIERKELKGIASSKGIIASNLIRKESEDGRIAALYLIDILLLQI
ncbi:12385_t:CDS:1, partial [Racocetra persica]